MNNVDAIKWVGRFRLEKYVTGEDRPYDIVTARNALLTAGATAMWQRLAGQGSVSVFDGTNTRMCVGDGTAAADPTHTDLQGALKTRKLVDAAPIITGAGIVFVATFGTADANHAWEEAGIANSAAGALLLNRVVQGFGTKTSGLTWVLTGSLSLA